MREWFKRVVLQWGAREAADRVERAMRRRQAELDGVEAACRLLQPVEVPAA